MIEVRRILCPVDFSETSRHALNHAAALARWYDATVSVVYVPMGGGGQIAGVSAALKSVRRDVRISGVEPAGAARMTASLAAGQTVSLGKTASIADGLLTLRPGELTFAHVQAFVDEVVTVDDDSIRAAVRWLFRHARLVAEPSGVPSS